MAACLQVILHALCVQAHSSELWIFASLLTLVFLKDDRVQEKRLKKETAIDGLNMNLLGLQD